MKIKGAIFDMDGVVVDNYHFHYKAWTEFTKKYKFALTEQIYRDRFNGKTNADIFRIIFGEVTREEIDKYAEEKESLYQKLYAPEMKATVGLIDFLEHLQKNKVKIALGTSAPTQNVDFIMDNLKLRKYFSVIVDGTQVEKGKPDPQVYQMCCMKLGLDPKVCVVFEDALAGLEAASRAGCYTVGVATSHKDHELRPKTENIIHDFTEPVRFF